MPGYPTLMLTVVAFLLVAALAAAACETTRGRFVRLLAEPQLRPASTDRFQPGLVSAAAEPVQETA